MSAAEAPEMNTERDKAPEGYTPGSAMNEIKYSEAANEISDLARFIRDRTDEVLLYPNRGNAGDALIAAGTYRFFERNKIPFRFIRDGERFPADTVLWYCGGGNFVGYYNDCACWLEKYARANPCVVLPHTINDTESLKKLPENTTLICRERESYRICKEHASCGIFLYPDMAFCLDPEDLGIVPEQGRGDLPAFRNDPEKTFTPPKGSIDLSRLYIYDHYNKESVYRCARLFLNAINDFETIHTNRLHVAVGGWLLKKKVRLYPNSYYKNRAVFEYSLEDSSVEFVEATDVLPTESDCRLIRYKLHGRFQRIFCKLRKLVRRFDEKKQ